jgi:hypothetical protein
MLAGAMWDGQSCLRFGFSRIKPPEGGLPPRVAAPHFNVAALTVGCDDFRNEDTSTEALRAAGASALTRGLFTTALSAADDSRIYLTEGRGRHSATPCEAHVFDLSSLILASALHRAKDYRIDSTKSSVDTMLRAGAASRFTGSGSSVLL